MAVQKEPYSIESTVVSAGFDVYTAVDRQKCKALVIVGPTRAIEMEIPGESDD